MGYRHSVDEIVVAGREVALEHGIAAVTYRAVAERLDMSDRMVVYYFPTKQDLTLAVVSSVAEQLRALLDEAFGERPLSARRLAIRSWPVLSSRAAEPGMRLFFQIVGLAAAGQEPYPGLASAMLDGWAQWLTPRVAAPTQAARREAALGLIAQIDGLLLVHIVSGGKVSRSAAKHLGFVDPGTRAAPRR